MKRVKAFHNDFVKLIFSFNSIQNKKSAKFCNEKENLADHGSWLSQTFRFRESNASCGHQAGNMEVTMPMISDTTCPG